MWTSPHVPYFDDSPHCKFWFQEFQQLLKFSSHVLWQLLPFGSYNTAAWDWIFSRYFQVSSFLVIVTDVRVCYFHFNTTFISFTILHHAASGRYVGRHFYCLRTSDFFSSTGCRFQIHTKLYVGVSPYNLDRQNLHLDVLIKYEFDNSDLSEYAAITLTTFLSTSTVKPYL